MRPPHGRTSAYLLDFMVILSIVTGLIFMTPTYSQQSVPVIRIGVVGSYDTFDPFSAKLRGSLAVIGMLYEPLVVIGGNGEVLPWLARYEIVSENVIRFTLAVNATWHNGDSVTSEDVLFTLSNLLRPSSAAEHPSNQLSGLVRDVRVIDERTVEVITSGTNYKVFEALSKLPVVHKRDYVRGSPLPIGSGPFSFVKLQGGNVELKAFEGYRSGPPSKYVIVKAYSSITELIEALRNGEIDIVNGFPFRPEHIPALSRGDIATISRAGDHLLSVFLNVAEPPTSSGSVRRALYELIDVPWLISRSGVVGEQVGFDLASSKHLWSIRPLRIEKVSNFTAASLALTEAGYNFSRGKWFDKEGRQLSLRMLVQSDDGSAVKVAESLKTLLEQSGVRVDTVLAPLSELFKYKDGEGGKYHIAVINVPYPDSIDEVYSTLLGSRGVHNWAGYRSERIDTIALALAKEVNVDSRMKLMQEAGGVISRDIPLIPLLVDVRIGAFRSDRLTDPIPWAPTSIQSLLNLKIVQRPVTMERVVSTVTTVIYITETQLRTVTVQVERPVEVAPEWIYVVAIALTSSMTAVMIAMVVVGAKTSRPQKPTTEYY